MAIYSVSQVTTYLREILEEDYDLQALSVRGEVSNAVRATSGHWYFTIKDSKSQLRCVFWRNQAMSSPHEPEMGQSYIVHGRISLYEMRGDLQLYVQSIERAGRGALYQQFLDTKLRLQEEGLFDPERKKPLPAFPHIIGIVTSPEAAALRDILKVLVRRYPNARPLLSPAAVQGVGAADTLCVALEALIDDGRPDVILICRGGGSIEDLWAFNDENLVRAVANSPIPIVSGIGHETDFTLVDFAASHRAPTPSAAIELATPSSDALRDQLRQFRAASYRSMQQNLERNQNQLESLSQKLERYSPSSTIIQWRQRVDEHRQHLTASTRRWLTLWRERTQQREKTLRTANPISILNRGYSYVTRASDAGHIASAAEIHADEELVLHFHDGECRAVARQE